MIEIKHLKALQELQKSGSLSAAAIQLHQTQSTLSHQYNKLEKKLGFKLFIRKSKPIKFTVQGKILLKLSKEILPKIHNAIENCTNSRYMILRLAIECHNCIQWLTPTLNIFKKKYPKVKIDFYSNMIFSPQKFLHQGKLDIVLTSEVLPLSNVFYAPIFDFEVRLVLSPNHPLVRKKSSIVPKDLESEIFMTYPIERNKLDIWKYFLQPSGIIPIFKNVNHTLLLIQMVSAQMGITALPNWIVDNFERQGLVVTRKLGNGIWGRLYAAIRNSEKKEFMIKTFIRTIKSHSHFNLKLKSHISNIKS